MIEAFKLRLNNAETVLKDHQERADKYKLISELKVVRQQDSNNYLLM